MGCLEQFKQLTAERNMVSGGTFPPFVDDYGINPSNFREGELSAQEAEE